MRFRPDFHLAISTTRYSSEDTALHHSYLQRGQHLVLLYLALLSESFHRSRSANEPPRGVSR